MQACVQFEDRVFDNGMLRSKAISTLNAVNKAATPALQAGGQDLRSATWALCQSCGPVSCNAFETASDPGSRTSHVAPINFC